MAKKKSMWRKGFPKSEDITEVVSPTGTRVLRCLGLTGLRCGSNGKWFDQSVNIGSFCVYAGGGGRVVPMFGCNEHGIEYEVRAWMPITPVEQIVAEIE
jgi:hypothetical protein